MTPCAENKTMQQLQHTNVNFKHFKYGVVTFHVNLNSAVYKILIKSQFIYKI